MIHGDRQRIPCRFRRCGQYDKRFVIEMFYRGHYMPFTRIRIKKLMEDCRPIGFLLTRIYLLFDCYDLLEAILSR